MITSRKIFYCLGILAFIFLLYCLGILSGKIEVSYLDEFLHKNIVTYKTIEPGYYYLLSLSNLWVLVFCVFNLKFSSNASNLLSARLGQCDLVSIFLILIFLTIWPVSVGHLPYPISYNEWPASFTHFLYQEDGLFEILTAVLLLLASIQFYLAGKYAAKHLPDRQIILTLFILSIFSMIFMMEEISWGQRIFSWDTPKLVTEFNLQNEINFHNIFNPIILLDSERIFSILISLALLLAILYKPRIKIPALRGLFPSGNYYFISILFVVAGMISTELFEEVFAVFLFYYSIDMKKLYSKTNPSTREVN